MADGRRAERAWWVVTGNGGNAQSVVGLERRIKGGGIEQWLISAQGARRLHHAGNDVVLWGAPLAPNGADFAEEAPLAVHAWSDGQARMPECSATLNWRALSGASPGADGSPQRSDAPPNVGDAAPHRTDGSSHEINASSHGADGLSHGAEGSSHGAGGSSHGANDVRVDTPGDLARWLRGTLPGLEVDPPAGFTVAVAKEAMFDFPRGIKELLALQAAFK
ncbi:MAG: hypothetical protein IT449_14995 [Phycisphaerales bacterium]|nr:hypothetical protein [Phycisphaerales bacterium]